jgi:hypothetical protein
MYPLRCLCVHQVEYHWFNVSDSLKACLEVVLFVDRSLLASVEKLLCLVMNLPNYSWSKEPS